MPCWAELTCPDPESGAAFYGGVFGWTAYDGTFRRDGLAVAGVRAGEPRWLPYVSTEDVAATAAAVTSAGGTAGEARSDPRGGYAACADPSGARFGVRQPGTLAGAQVVNEFGTVLWADLVTTDLAAADPFYAAVFGWTRRPIDYGDGFLYHEWVSAGRPVAGGREMAAPEPFPPHWMTTLLVADCADTVRRAESLGGAVALPPTPAAVGTYAMVADAQGAAFGVIELIPRFLADMS
ncbi:VOC family protein [Actinocatenispora rupis]|uniref:Hydroxylase n=1 Tax=Actinocatenispora rupis TaxID=519421 RepID=A0A8J3NEC8_9ACTN|nr:hydroxylase [Actinocatenispora rupis]